MPKEATLMKGKAKVLEVLQKMLKEELGSISQYFVHAEMLENWGYKRLSVNTRKISINEMKHAEALIERILFLEGTPNLGDLPKLNIGKDVKSQLENDLTLEQGAIIDYNAGVAACRNAGDNASADIIQTILEVEEGHADFFEKQLSLIEQMGMANYLAQQLAE
jgi:bacterioferritin